MYALELKGLEDITRKMETEYLLTNGLGGYASSTVIGCPTRKYHGVLVAALNPPVERIMTVSRISETIIVENRAFDLKAYAKSATEICETDCLTNFKKDHGVHFTYGVDGAFTVHKSQYLCHGENTALLRYEINCHKDGLFRLMPELSIRDHHDVSGPASVKPTWSVQKERVDIVHPDLPSGLRMALMFQNDERMETIAPSRILDAWCGPYHLRNEAERGLQETEYTYAPFEWDIDMASGESKVCYLWVSTEAALPQTHPEAQIQQLKERHDLLLEQGKKRLPGLEESLSQIGEALVLAADDFIVNRQSTGKATILAGYPWFTDWGRDSMIALSGLTLSAGRPEDFREIYETFEKYMKNGVLPNVFPDKGDEPRYNTVDATLWMPIAMLRYYEETHDIQYVKAHFLPTLQQIIHHYQLGTLNNTYMDADGLIWSGDESTQLTWMDVKVNGWVVTPRHGKAVEINALWYNTLQIGYFFNIMVSGSENLEAAVWKKLSETVKQSFVKTFWNESGGCLYDVVRGEERIDSIRPNQLFALALPYPLLEEKRAQSVLEVVKLHLWMPYGLRSLSPKDPAYHGYYGGDVLARDGAYHRGTGWGWLIGPYLDSLYYVSQQEKQPEETTVATIEAIILEASTHLNDICIGQICENFDGDAPFHGRGCMAQAWSVAELLRWVAKLNDLKLRRTTS